MFFLKWPRSLSLFSLISSGWLFPHASDRNLYVLTGYNGFHARISSDFDSIFSAYGPRFETLGRVTQVELRGKTFLTRDGLLDESGIKLPLGPLGYAEAKPGETFVKLGVGDLVREEEKRYTFYKAYAMAHRHPVEVRRDGSNAVVFTAMGTTHPIWKYRYVKRYSVDANEPVLRIEYELENLGSDTIRTEQYNHNWFSFVGSSGSKDYDLSMDFAPVGKGKGPFSLDVNKILIHAPAEKPTFMEFRTLQKPETNALTLALPAKGMQVRVEGDFPISHLGLFADGNAICPEVFYSIELPPGQTLKWTRIYRFIVDND